jgi:hypothetical protein
MDNFHHFDVAIDYPGGHEWVELFNTYPEYGFIPLVCAAALLLLAIWLNNMMDDAPTIILYPAAILIGAAIGNWIVGLIIPSLNLHG